MGTSKYYYTLIASLPYMPVFYRAKRLPINRQRLDERLSMLESDDRSVISLAEEFIEWQRQPVDQTNVELARFYRRLMTEVTQPNLREMIEYRMDQRTIMVGLRYRQRGLPLPRGSDWGVGRWVQHIEFHWEHPDFRLGSAYPWIADARRLLESGKALELEKLLMNRVWNYLARISESKTFQFESVLAYLFRWDITQRWLLYSRQRARERLSEIKLETLGNFQQLF